MTARTAVPGRGAPGDPPARPATIYDVARAAGVSGQTVSRFLKGHSGIRPQTRDRVVQALEDLRYRPNLTARSLTTGRSHRIGALTHQIDQVGPSRIVQGASVAAREAGYVLDIITIDMTSAKAVQDALDMVAQLDLAGVLALSSTDEMTSAFQATSFRVPTVVAREEDDALLGNSSPPGTRGIAALVDHLAGLGHRRFLHVAGPTTWFAARNRARAFTEAVASAGLQSTAIIHGDWSARSGYEAISRLPSGLGGATAVMAANDQMALGVMVALRERGLDVPGDISVTGVDDIPEAAYFHPALTTLRVDFLAEGRDVVHRLLAQIQHDRVVAPVHPSSSLVVRGSTALARSTG